MSKQPKPPRCLLCGAAWSLGHMCADLATLTRSELEYAAFLRRTGPLVHAQPDTTDCE
jgi:hypothetical protein